MTAQRYLTAAVSPRRARVGVILVLLAVGMFVAAALVTALPATAEATTGTSTASEPTVVAQETTTSATAATEETTTSAATVPSAQEGIVPPSAVQEPLNPGWLTDQMDVRVLPEYDLDAVLVIVGFSLPADVALPATVRFPLPTGAIIGGIGEVGPDGGFEYNYTDSYPPVETVGDWDIASIEVTTYRQLQVDYYYDPGLPKQAGERSFPLLVQMPMDVGMLVLHVQEPARATDFVIQPPLQGVGAAGDGFTYHVGSFSAIQSGSTLGQVVSYYKPDATLSIDSEPQATSTQFNTTTVLLAAILIVVIIVGGLVIYRLYSNSASANQKKRGSSSKQAPPASASPATNKRQRRAAQGAAAAAGKKKGQKGSAPEDKAPAQPPPQTAEATPAEPAAEGEDAAEKGGEATEYCVSCGEELNTESRFCPNCGEARP